jgi:uncharacterized membrane protein
MAFGSLSDSDRYMALGLLLMEGLQCRSLGLVYGSFGVSGMIPITVAQFHASGPMGCRFYYNS